MENYAKIKLHKMGRYSLLPLDLDNWFTESTSRYFRRLFGFGKGILIIETLYDGGWEHAYTPEWHFQRIYRFIKQSTKRDYKSLERRLLRFYVLRHRLKKQLPKPTARQIAAMTNRQLASVFAKNKDWAHQATVWDQFGWIAEHYWNPLFKTMLIKKGIKEGSPEYYDVLFALIKPVEISTTLREKRALLGQAIMIKRKEKTLTAASRFMARHYGWMSVSAYGKPWDAQYYHNELSALIKKNIAVLEKEYRELVAYRSRRNAAVAQFSKRYHFTPRELQPFIDFGLTLDGRNEAEYLVSYCGYYVLPLYTEISKRLYISVDQLRLLYEDEVIAALHGTLDPAVLLLERRRFTGHGYDRAMKKRTILTPRQAEALFKTIEKKVKYVGSDGATTTGVCASPGVAVGKAKIVIGPADNHKVKPGDIMISVATMVDHLPAMKKAAAIITEVGSLTCHAAVVSREFGVPCVVSFPNATKKFKDGQLVRVNADQGLVEIMKK